MANKGLHPLHTVPDWDEKLRPYSVLFACCVGILIYTQSEQKGWVGPLTNGWDEQLCSDVAAFCLCKGKKMNEFN